MPFSFQSQKQPLPSVEWEYSQFPPYDRIQCINQDLYKKATTSEQMRICRKSFNNKFTSIWTYPAPTQASDEAENRLSTKTTKLCQF